MCGLSDMIDGYIARKTNSVSKIGSRLDSIADIVLGLAMACIFLPIIQLQWQALTFIIVIAFIRIAALCLVLCKYKTFAIVHTYGNKAAGFAVFLFPLLYNYVNKIVLIYSICVVSNLAAIEELIIHITSKELTIDFKGLFFK